MCSLCSLTRGVFWYKIYDYGTRESVHCSQYLEGCSPKTNRAVSPTLKYTEKMGPGKSVHYKEVFTNQGCSL